MLNFNFSEKGQGEKVKLCYTDADSFIVYIKNDDIYKDIAEDVETTILGKIFGTKHVKNVSSVKKLHLSSMCEILFTQNH